MSKPAPKDEAIEEPPKSNTEIGSELRALRDETRDSLTEIRQRMTTVGVGLDLLAEQVRDGRSQQQAASLVMIALLAVAIVGAGVGIGIYIGGRSSTEPRFTEFEACFSSCMTAEAAEPMPCSAICAGKGR